MGERIDFDAINRAALVNSEAMVRQWLQRGKIEGSEYVALNPRRSDRRLGSFKVNLDSGRWADFAADVSGSDLISLAAYLSGSSQVEAARNIAVMLGLPLDD